MSIVSAGEVRLIAARYEVYDNSPSGIEGIWATELEFLVPEYVTFLNLTSRMIE